MSQVQVDDIELASQASEDSRPLLEGESRRGGGGRRSRGRERFKRVSSSFRSGLKGSSWLWWALAVLGALAIVAAFAVVYGLTIPAFALRHEAAAPVTRSVRWTSMEESTVHSLPASVLGDMMHLSKFLPADARVVGRMTEVDRFLDFGPARAGQPANVSEVPTCARLLLNFDVFMVPMQGDRLRTAEARVVRGSSLYETNLFGERVADIMEARFRAMPERQQVNGLFVAWTMSGEGAVRGMRKVALVQRIRGNHLYEGHRRWALVIVYGPVAEEERAVEAACAAERSTFCNRSPALKAACLDAAAAGDQLEEAARGSAQTLLERARSALRPDGTTSFYILDCHGNLQAVVGAAAVGSWEQQKQAFGANAGATKALNVLLECDDRVLSFYGEAERVRPSSGLLTEYHVHYARRLTTDIVVLVERRVGSEGALRPARCAGRHLDRAACRAAGCHYLETPCSEAGACPALDDLGAVAAGEVLDYCSEGNPYAAALRRAAVAMLAPYSPLLWTAPPPAPVLFRQPQAEPVARSPVGIASGDELGQAELGRVVAMNQERDTVPTYYTLVCRKAVGSSYAYYRVVDFDDDDSAHALGRIGSAAERSFYAAVFAEHDGDEVPYPGSVGDHVVLTAGYHNMHGDARNQTGALYTVAYAPDFDVAFGSDVVYDDDDSHSFVPCLFGLAVFPPQLMGRLPVYPQ